MAPPAVTPATKEIPYDYVATFKFEGRRGNRVQDVINISVEGAFVAVSISYSFMPAPLPQTTLPLVDRDRILSEWARNALGVGTVPLGTLVANIVSIAPVAPPRTVNDILNRLQPVLDLRMLLQCLQLHLCGVHFKYSIIDSGSGRELQNQPIHNVAGLGEPTGERPFRHLAKPMLFLPRSTIRIEVEELAEGPIYGFDDGTRRVGGELQIVLGGYKILGYGAGLP
jgi:hypothetical protein